MFHSEEFRPLVKHENREWLSAIQLAEDKFSARIRATGFGHREEGTFVFTLRQAFGGAKDGLWLTSSILREDPSPSSPPATI